MFTILFLLSSFSYSLSSPVVIPEHDHFQVFGHMLPRATVDVAGYRTKQEIVWSCLATIFACTWVAIHPNLPGPGDSGWTRFKRRATTMIYAMIAPEFVTLWALQQWMAAQRIKREFNKIPEENVSWYTWVREIPGDCWTGFRDAVVAWFDDPRKQPNEWTLTHGFMVQMGGFILYDGEMAKHALTFKQLKKLMDKGEIEPPRVSEHEINDKSKGDFLTKLVVVLQTSWFVFQCVTRWVKRLPVTELEVVTLAFASLNVITYGLWWKKPQSVLVAVRVQLKHSQLSGPAEGGVERQILVDAEESPAWITRKLGEEMRRGLAGWLLGIPYRLILVSLRPLKKIMEDYSDVFEHRSLRVPMVFFEGDGNPPILPFMVISVFFGGLHLIPWPFQFPSTTERWLWRSSAIFITAEPMIFSLGVLLDALNDRYHSSVLNLPFSWSLEHSTLHSGSPYSPATRIHHPSLSASEVGHCH